MSGFNQTNFWIVLFLLLISCEAGCFAATQSTRLAFVANLDGNWDLFTVEEDGANLIRLTSTPYDEKEPSWSKDKKEIVYATSEGQIYILDFIHEKKRQLTIDNEKGQKFAPCLSPKGDKIAFIKFLPNTKDDTDLVLYNIEKCSSETLIHQYAAQFWPAWSPDGKRIVYINSHCSVDCGRDIQELWICDPNGGYARQLLLTNSLCREPSWSPDGKKLAFSSDKSGNFDIWILNLEDWGLHQLTTYKGLDVSPTWSPDGEKIAFISTRSGIMEIWIKDLVKGDLRRLRPFGEKDIECKDVAW